MSVPTVGELLALLSHFDPDRKLSEVFQFNCGRCRGGPHPGDSLETTFRRVAQLPRPLASLILQTVEALGFHAADVTVCREQNGSGPCRHQVPGMIKAGVCRRPIYDDARGAWSFCGRAESGHCSNGLGCRCEGVHLHAFARPVARLSAEELWHLRTLRVEHPETGQPVLDGIGAAWLSEHFDNLLASLDGAESEVA